MYRFDAALPFMFRSRSTPAVAPVSAANLDDPERALWLNLAAGDVLALRDVYRAHHTQVRAFAQRLLGDAAAAEDLVQEVFIALPKAARNFRFETTASSYLLGVAAHSASKHIRAAKRRRAASERLARLPSTAPVSPDEEAHAARLVARLMRAIDELPDKLRIVFVLCQIEERDATEVGAILGIPSSTVRARLRAARERLQSQETWLPEEQLP